ncbi:adenylate cyclase type 2 isoform X3 [Pieris napi]|uniref:adenylate cyclase type 2 isoform X3 n=1 Tax=Pieris napi TaxID=78633 RepID=UPI001FBB1A14|nr:adenylate cyclase type 2 isoform X3 [Pieris napi]
MQDDSLSRTTGSVVLQVGALELLARYSMNSGRATSVLSSIYEFRSQEVEQAGGKQWNWKYLRDQFYQKDLEGLYRKYDNKLRETLIYIYVSLLVFFSTIHIASVLLSTYYKSLEWKSTYLSVAMYLLRIGIPLILLCKSIYIPLKERWYLVPIITTVILTVDLVLSDITETIVSANENTYLRPAYFTVALLAVYVFLPMRNNFFAITLGVIVSASYAFVIAFISYCNNPQREIASYVIYLIGVNLMGIYFRLMNEIITRRSFLDRRACVESTLRLKFVKEQEERLMLSILPEHIMSKVRQDIRNMFLNIRSHSYSHNMKSFSQLYVEEHDNVSILYADVVNYTQISTTLSPLRMVELLNELFGRFDEASEEHDVLRIKFLGDCYYCVSGIPKPTSQHAKNCVDLGLEMIHIIKDVREKRSLNIDMRIGVHSGKILCGLIGIRKWQFDIWSKDVTIANKMESTGKAGKVHITKQTLELLLDYAREYIIEPNFESQNDQFIMNNRIETYLISRPPRPMADYKPFRRASVGLNKIINPRSRHRRSENRNYRRTTAFMDENLVEYQQMLKAADAQMAKEIEDMTSGKEHFKQESKLNRFTLMYKSIKLEKSYLLLPDPLFKYYITCCLVIFLLITTVNILTTSWSEEFDWDVWIPFAILILILMILQPLTWFQFFWTKYRGINEPKGQFLRYIYDLSVTIIKSTKVRTAIYMVISLGLAITSILKVLGCNVKEEEPAEIQTYCVSSWNPYLPQHVTQCWGLALLLNFIFSRVFFMFKWVVAGGMTIFYLFVIWEMKGAYFSTGITWNVGLDPRISQSLSVLFITITLYWIDRSTEYRHRLDHLWQKQLTEEQEEAETMLKVNNMLLENILPAHVVQVYLDLNRPIDELYYEKYDNVAVMFASLTDYKLGIESDTDLSDKLILSILDEVISDFDRLLLMGSSLYKVEKIKVAGWTYMAACGLDPNRRGSFDTSSYCSVGDRNQNNLYNRAIVVTMVEFAAAMMMQLQNFNRGSFQSFEGLNLRIGISNGEVAAGVVGSLKPLYDIWGNAVNLASRMDSTGETGRIQVTENTAFILDECGILTTYRGETFVKGAGYIKTYYVPLDENFHLVKKEQSQSFFKKQRANGYYSARNSQLSDTSIDSFETESHHSMNIGELSTDFSDHNEDDTDNIYENDHIDDIKVMGTHTPRDHLSDTSSEFDNNSIIETPC